MNIVWTEPAVDSLHAIRDYIARDNPVRAASFVRELYRSCLDIADMPESWPFGSGA